MANSVLATPRIAATALARWATISRQSISALVKQPSKIAAGYGHTCALLSDGKVKCWGRNDYGQLGLGDTVHRGGQPEDMGDSLRTVDLGAGKTAVAITSSVSHTCALLNSSEIKCWGLNGGGLLGLGESEHRGDDAGEMGDNLPAVNLGTGKTGVTVTTGNGRTCALLNDGNIKCWGINNIGQLGLGDTVTRGDNPGEMGDGLPAVNLGTGKTAVSVAAGDSHTCALLDGGDIKCWGFNNGCGSFATTRSSKITAGYRLAVGRNHRTWRCVAGAQELLLVER